MHPLEDAGLPHDLDRTLLPDSVDSDIYKMMVLRFASDCTEEDVDQQFLRMAIDMGINIPQNPKTTLDLVTNNVSALALESVPDHEPSPSRTSQSTHLTSDSSSEYKQPSNTSSITTVSSSPASISSTSSIRSSYTKFKRGFRRISALRRRKTVDVPIPFIPLPTSAVKILGSPPAYDPPRSEPLTATTTCYKSASSQTEEVPVLEPCSQSLSMQDLEEKEEALAARQRSIDNIQLSKLRACHLDEQSRFIKFEAKQYHLLRLKQVESKQALLDRYNKHSQILKVQQADALTSLEQRHLLAEVDLNQTLQLERQGCETRLRHMKAYCNPRSSIIGMPNRNITKKDRRLLEQQHHVWNGMDNLHAARINVLREKQTKQLERVAAKQASELETMADDLKKETEESDAMIENEEIQLRSEFSERKHRLVARWTLAEAIERRRLENITEDVYGPLPPIPWADRKSIAELDNGEEPYRGFAHEAIQAYNATALPIIGVDL